VKCLSVYKWRMSIDDLPVDGEVIRRLQLLGIETMEQLRAFSQDELYVQFGQEGLLLWELCRRLGYVLPPVDEEEPLEDVFEVDEWGPVALDRLFRRLGKQLCIQMRVHFGGTRINVNFSRPTQSAKRAFEMLQGRLVGRAVGAHDEVRVELEASAPRYQQMALFGRPVLQVRTEPHLLMRVVWDDRKSPLPERWAHLESVVVEGVTRPMLTPRPGNRKGNAIDRWRVKEDWWTKRPIERTYYRMETGKRYFEDASGCYVH